MTTQTKRALVRWARLAPQSHSTLLSVLEGLLGARVSQSRAGLVLTSTSANGHQASFELDEDMTPGDARDLAEELITRYEEAKTKLIEQDEIAAPTDEQIANEMLRCLTAFRGYRSDFSGLRSEPEEVDA